MRKRAELRKAEIVAALLGLADSIGPDRVTTGAVASSIGITQAALFRHFPTKDTLWQTVAEHVAEGLEEAWDDGNVTGLNGWVGPGRIARPVDDEAIRQRRRTVDALLAGEQQ